MALPEDVARHVDGAWRVVGAYTGGRLVGFARARHDGIAFAYLADVFVLPGHRDRGLGRGPVGTMTDEGRGRVPLAAEHRGRARPLRPVRFRRAGP